MDIYSKRAYYNDERFNVCLEMSIMRLYILTIHLHSIRIHFHYKDAVAKSNKIFSYSVLRTMYIINEGNAVADNPSMPRPKQEVGLT